MRAVRFAVAVAVVALLGAFVLTQPASAQSSTLTVATNGNDANSGSVSSPLRTIQRAVDLAEPGTVIQIRGGTYDPSVNIRIEKSGTAAQPITMRAYAGEHVVIDGEHMPNTPAPLGESYPRIERGAIHVGGDWWRFEGLEIINGPYGIFAIESNHNVYRDLVTRENYETGLHLVLDSSDNQVINLDSYGNRDPRKHGESADGLAIKQGAGSGNVVIGARMWNNADDGFDSWDFTSPITIEDSLAWGNGFNRWGFPEWEGDGNGFKLGRGDANHEVDNNIAFGNAVGGFIDNGNTASLHLERNTAWNNGGTGFDFDRSTSTLNHNLSVANGSAASLGSSGGAGNSWELKDSWSDSDLASTNASTITGPREADGSIPTSDFLRPNGYPDLGADFTGEGGNTGDPDRYEAEDAPAACDGSIDSNHSGYSGTGFCNTDNTTGTAAQFTIDAAASGTATVEIRYANGASGDRTADIVVNDVLHADGAFEPTGAWNSWATATVTVPVSAGPNTIRLVATTGDGLGNIDYIEVDVTGSVAQNRYEAENAPATCDGTIDADHSGYSGSGFCNTDNTTGAAAQFTVEAAESGTATIVVQFANGGSSGRPADVTVNGSTVDSVLFASTGAWNSWSTETFTVELNSGSNTIRLTATGSDGLPNIDYLDATTGAA